MSIIYIGSAKRGEPSEAKSGKSINVVHISSTFAPSLTTAIIVRRIGFNDRLEKGVFICQWRRKNRSRFRVVLTKKCKEGI